jgi:hypothetical protein
MNIQEILRVRGIGYLEYGKNVKRGNINLRCPFCGESDKSAHLGINIHTGAWACWRNTEHRGRRLHRLLIKLLGCSYDTAQAMLTDRMEMGQAVSNLYKREVTQPVPKPVGVIPGLRKLTALPRHSSFHRYLHKRGFDFQHVPSIIGLYDLHCAQFGQFNKRIVFPIQVNNKVLGYTGRCIDNGNLRYLSEPGPTVKQNILWYDLLKAGGRRLYICEGPFDALKVDYVLRTQGFPDRATCLFGVSYTQKQLTRLHKLIPRYEQAIILFDRDAIAQAHKLDQSLASSTVIIQGLPAPFTDPGAMTWDGITALALGARQKGSQGPSWA